MESLVRLTGDATIIVQVLFAQIQKSANLPEQ